MTEPIPSEIQEAEAHQLRLQLQKLILPIVATQRDGTVNCVGTGFLIAANGRYAHMVTAAHVVGHLRKIENPYSRHHPTGYPSSVLEYPADRLGLHPVAKPIKLLKFLIDTYTRPGAVVLDNAMGAGSTGVACALAGRQFVGIEKEPKFFYIAEQIIRT